MRTELQRFEAFINKNAEGGCWLWTGGKVARRYGSFGIGGRIKHKTLYAHRFAHANYVGPIPEGLNVCHNCPTGDNPLCVNPAHLYLGTQKENLDDARAKGRLVGFPGERNGNAKLSESDVLEIRKRYRYRTMGCKRLGKIYKTSHQNIWSIVNKQAWTSV